MARPGSLVRLAMAQLDEDAVGVLWMDPGDVRSPAVPARAFALEMRDGAGNVPAFEAHQVDALAVPREEAPRGLVGVRRLQQLDVANPRRQDRVLEAELLRLSTVVHHEAEEPRVA